MCKSRLKGIIFEKRARKILKYLSKQCRDIITSIDMVTYIRLILRTLLILWSLQHFAINHATQEETNLE